MVSSLVPQNRQNPSFVTQNGILEAIIGIIIYQNLVYITIVIYKALYNLF